MTPQGLVVIDIVAGPARSRSCARLTGVPLARRHRGRDQPPDQELDMPEAFICDAIRTPFGRYGGALAAVRTDDLARDPDRGAHGAQPAASTGARSTT